MKKNIPNGILIIAVLIFGWLSIDVISQTGFYAHINFELGRNYGGMLGGILSFLSIVLIYFTLSLQTESFNRSSFESKFFELIKYHRANVAEWEHTPPEFKEEKIVKGRKVFVHIHRQILRALEELTPFFKNKNLEDIMLPDALNELKRNANFISRKIDLMLLQKINIAYMIVFFGVLEEGRRILSKVVKKKYNEEFYEKILIHFQNIPVKRECDLDKVKNNTHIKYFGGHQNRLGHYMRHYYQSINYVNSYKPFKSKYPDKYNYVKMYRAQLSTYEQSVFFFNSLSDLGNVWELDQSNLNSNDQLITKYNLIKNIPTEFILDINLNAFYPDVEYERGDKSDNKKILIKNYK
ncbi:MAG: putative phage abortive infection protein [Ignavibacteriales bacterium]|nr:putative phage abortive infection protein [Ignavibacteriales bacterium]